MLDSYAETLGYQECNGWAKSQSFWDSQYLQHQVDGTV
jgi:hypothetical protein